MPHSHPDETVLVCFRFVRTHQQKSGATVPVTRPAVHGSRIALQCRTSNAEAHAGMYIVTPNPFSGAGCL